MNLIKKIVFNLFLIYQRYFPLNRGKAFLASILNKIFGAFKIETKDNVSLSVFINSSMDISYFDKVNDSHTRIKNEILLLKKGGTYVDIGANIGYFTFLASKAVGEKGIAIAVEPSKREFVRLLKMIPYNKGSNIIPLNLAISNTTEIAKLHVSKNHTGLNKVSNQEEANENYELILTQKLENIIPLGLTIDLIKIDVEGLEFNVLKGLELLFIEKRVKKIAIEITDSYLKKFNSSKQLLYGYLENHGFKSTYNENEWQYDELFTLVN